jgi:hypothetical protein
VGCSVVGIIIIILENKENKITAVKMSMFWVVTLCGLLGRHQRFGGTYCAFIRVDFKSTQSHNPERQYRHRKRRFILSDEGRIPKTEPCIRIQYELSFESKSVLELLKLGFWNSVWGLVESVEVCANTRTFPGMLHCGLGGSVDIFKGHQLTFM